MKRSSLERLDEWVDDSSEVLRENKIINRFFYALTECANHSLLWHAINLIVNARLPDRKARMARMALVLAAESALINGAVKQTFRRQRPVHEAVRPYRLRKPRTTSFPSGHATSAFCAAVLLSESSSTWRTRAFWYGLAGAVSYSRIHVRLHHASDVIGGVFIGLALGNIACRAMTQKCVCPVYGKSH